MTWWPTLSVMCRKLVSGAWLERAVCRVVPMRHGVSAGIRFEVLLGWGIRADAMVGQRTGSHTGIRRHWISTHLIILTPSMELPPPNSA